MVPHQGRSQLPPEVGEHGQGDFYQRRGRSPKNLYFFSNQGKISSFLLIIGPFLDFLAGE